MRHRIAIRDLSLIFATMLVGLYLVYAFDVLNRPGFAGGVGL